MLFKGLKKYSLTAVSLVRTAWAVGIQAHLPLIPLQPAHAIGRRPVLSRFFNTPAVLFLTL